MRRTIPLDELGATPERQDSTGNGTRMALPSTLPNGGAEPAGSWSGSHSHRPLSEVQLSGSPRVLSGGWTVERTIIGRGYSASGVRNGETWPAQRVGDSLLAEGAPQTVRAQEEGKGRRAEETRADAPATSTHATPSIAHFPAISLSSSPPRQEPDLCRCGGRTKMSSQSMFFTYSGQTGVF
eukprot:scaffold1640_cov37-Tisochrysis_lutea.AAC.5